MGRRYYLRAHEERFCLHRVCHRRLLQADRWVGVIRFHADFRLCRCRRSTRRSCVLKKQQVWCTIRITGRSMSAWSTTNDFPSTALQLPPGLLVTPMTMHWLKTSTVLTRGELIHNRRWDDVVEVEIATFEWVSWWNETRLHQSLGYRTPVEVEDAFWEQDGSRELWKIR